MDKLNLKHLTKKQIKPKTITICGRQKNCKTLKKILKIKLNQKWLRNVVGKKAKKVGKKQKKTS